MSDVTNQRDQSFQVSMNPPEQADTLVNEMSPSSSSNLSHGNTYSSELLRSDDDMTMSSYSTSPLGQHLSPQTPVDETRATGLTIISPTSSGPLLDDKHGISLSTPSSDENNFVDVETTLNPVQDDEPESADACISVPNFVNTIIKKRKRIKSSQEACREAAKQIQLEMASMSNENGIKMKTWKRGMRRLLDIAEGDVGLALFIPFNWEAFESLEVDSTHHSFVESSDEEELIVDSDDDVESYPPILSMEQMQQIHSEGLPATVRLMTWKRCYSLERDGVIFDTMLRASSKYEHTLIVIKTVTGDILGGYADSHWKSHNSPSIGRSTSFFGGGKAFLFASNPSGNINEGDDIQFYRWTGSNGYSQICDEERGALGMGGGGAFGFYVQDDFTKGSSGACDTFGNPPLINNHDGSFEILDVEVYGFESMSMRLFSPRPKSSALASANAAVNSMTCPKSLTSLIESSGSL